MALEKVAVLIPCYNEEKTIRKVVWDFRKALPDAIIYVYDNNSSDRTVEEAAAAGATIRHEYRQGKGNVIRSMFRQIYADCYIMVDGDDTYPAEHAAEMAQLILAGKADMVVGDRLSSTYFTENKRPFHNFGNVLVRTLINRLFNGEVKDIMTGYRAFSREFVKSFPVLSKGFEIETEMTIHALDKNFKLREIPVDYRDRIEGSESKLNTLSDGFRVLGTIGLLFRDYRPLLFFSLISVVLLALGLALFLPVLFDYLNTHLVLRFPTLIVSMFVILASLLSFVCGLVLSTLRKMRSEEYECYLNQFHYLETIMGRNDAE